ncbi:MAG TPA: hypothetical protein VM242_06435 [Acidimicrobiales bacterium]|nr:hypothetical protein [Acidimicrobiales bacterium]
MHRIASIVNLRPDRVIAPEASTGAPTPTTTFEATSQRPTQRSGPAPSARHRDRGLIVDQRCQHVVRLPRQLASRAAPDLAEDAEPAQLA